MLGFNLSLLVMDEHFVKKLQIKVKTPNLSTKAYVAPSKYDRLLETMNFGTIQTDVYSVIKWCR
jgi:hypothetical protein